MITPIFKPIGASSHQLAKKFGTLFETKATHTGTLDPVASGVLVIVSGEDRHEKSKFATNNKTYECRVLLGDSTDTHDVLGLITNSKLLSQREVSDWTRIFQKMTGNITQKIPVFSAKRWGGKSLFDYAKSQTPTPDFYDQITIYDNEVIKFENKVGSEVMNEISSTIEKIEGEFRQSTILEQWQATIQPQRESCILTLQITCSKRTYIRGLVRDISEQSGVPACILSLTRTHNGPYSIADCVCLL